MVRAASDALEARECIKDLHNKQNDDQGLWTLDSWHGVCPPERTQSLSHSSSDYSNHTQNETLALCKASSDLHSLEYEQIAYIEAKQDDSKALGRQERKMVVLMCPTGSSRRFRDHSHDETTKYTDIDVSFFLRGSIKTSKAFVQIWLKLTWH
jgi:hypothetical protein